MSLLKPPTSLFRYMLIVSITLIASACAIDPMVEMPDVAVIENVADIEHGKTTFNTMCNVCHSVQQTGGPIEGPNLIGIVGREAASQPDFDKYSSALKTSGLTWNIEVLDRFLANPMAMVPGTLMPMRIPDDQTRADVIAYLSTLDSSE